MDDSIASGNIRLAIVGLGYVGLPLAVEFGKRYDTIGYDINPARVEELRNNRDSTLEMEPEELAQAVRLGYSTSVEDIRDCNVYIVTVPTAIDAVKRPDLAPLVAASGMIGRSSNRGTWSSTSPRFIPDAPRKSASRSWSGCPVSR